MTDLPTDIRQVSVNRVTLGIIISTAVLAGSISWSSSRLVSRLDAVEATVEAIQDSMDLQSYARVEDLDHVHQRVDGLTDDEVEAVIAFVRTEQERQGFEQ